MTTAQPQITTDRLYEQGNFVVHVMPPGADPIMFWIMAERLSDVGKALMPVTDALPEMTETTIMIYRYQRLHAAFIHGAWWNPASTNPPKEPPHDILSTWLEGYDKQIEAPHTWEAWCVPKPLRHATRIGVERCVVCGMVRSIDTLFIHPNISINTPRVVSYTGRRGMPAKNPGICPDSAWNLDSAVSKWMRGRTD